MNTRSRWFDLAPQSAGKLAFMLHRLTGLGLVAYLYLHLAVLAHLRLGSKVWDGLMQLMRSPWVLLLDGILLFGIVFHGLNGLRLTLVGLGLSLGWQRWLFWGSLVLALGVTVMGIWAMR